MARADRERRFRRPVHEGALAELFTRFISSSLPRRSLNRIDVRFAARNARYTL